MLKVFVVRKIVPEIVQHYVLKGWQTLTAVKTHDKVVPEHIRGLCCD